MTGYILGDRLEYKEKEIDFNFLFIHNFLMDRYVNIRNWTNIVLNTLITILGIVCFPANPLVLTGILEVEFHLPLFIIGCIIWVFGMVLVMVPIVMFPRLGGVPQGKSFVNTTRIVDTGIYALVRHPQYTGGIYSIFITTVLWYPHVLFAILSIIGIVVIYMSVKEEDKRLIEKFGNDYIAYMERVPGMNIFLGIARVMGRKRA
ncbi:methyltransferase family protein [Chloroflexota bacterium]